MAEQNKASLLAVVTVVLEVLAGLRSLVHRLRCCPPHTRSCRRWRCAPAKSSSDTPVMDKDRTGQVVRVQVRIAATVVEA